MWSDITFWAQSLQHRVASGGDPDHLPLHPLEAPDGGHGDDEARPPGHHHPGGQHGAQVVAPQPHAVNSVPAVGRLSLPELLAYQPSSIIYPLSTLSRLTDAAEDGRHPGVRVVDEYVEPPALLGPDPGEQLLHLRVLAVVHRHADRVAAALLLEGVLGQGV